MSYLGQSGYQTNNYPFPSEFVDESTKNADKTYFLNWSRAILAQYFNDKSFIPYSARDKIRMLRQYGSATQPESIAMKKVFPQYGNKKSGAKNKDRMPWSGINSEILPVMPKFKSTIFGMFEDIEETLFAQATDSHSTSEKENQKYQMLADQLLDDVIESVNKEVGTPRRNKESWRPKNEQQLKTYEEMGGFRVAAENIITTLVDHAINRDSDWETIKTKALDDLMDLGYFFIWSRVDPTGTKAYSEYIDPEYLIIEFDKDNDFKDPKYAGFIKSTSIDDLRKSGDFEHGQLKHIANSYFKHNKTHYDWDYYDSNDPYTGMARWNQFRVDITVNRWRSFKTEYKQKLRDKEGNVFQIINITQEEFEEIKGGNGDVADSDVYRTDTEMVYKCNHIIGTDFVYNYGYEYDMVRDEANRVHIPVFGVKVPGMSFTERCKSILNEIQTTFIKMQSCLMKSRNKSVVMDYQSLSNLQIKGKKMDPYSLLNLFAADGKYIYKSTTRHSEFNTKGQPVYELEGGMGAQFQELLQLFEFYRKLLQEFSGITPEAAGGYSVPERQSATLSEMMYDNTNNNIKPIIQKYHKLKQDMCNNLSFRIQDLVKNVDASKKYYQNLVGKQNVESIIAPDGTLRSLGIRIDLLPDKKIKDSIEQSAIDALRTPREDGGNIDEDDFIYITMLLEFGKINQARKHLAIKISEAKKKHARDRKAEQEAMRAHEIQKAEIASKDKQAEQELKKYEIDKKLEVEERIKKYEINMKYKTAIDEEKAKRGMDEVVDNERNPQSGVYNEQYNR